VALDAIIEEALWGDVQQMLERFKTTRTAKTQSRTFYWRAFCILMTDN
jgi:hypothetical protein